jgi:hypothetical protein
MILCNLLVFFSLLEVPAPSIFALKMEAAGSFKILGTTNHTTWHHNPEGLKDLPWI